MDRPSPSRAELLTAAGMRTILGHLLLELEPRKVDLDAIVGTAPSDVKPAEIVDRMRAEFERSAAPPDIFGLDRWLTRELSMDFDPVELSTEVRTLLVEIMVRWIVLVGTLRQHRRALLLAEAASALATTSSDRARVALASCRALVGCGRGDLPFGETLRAASAAHATARELGFDDAAVAYAELHLRCFAGRASALPVRRRLRDLAAASQLAERLLSSTDDARARAELVAERTRIVTDRERLARLGWFHRCLGFAPDS